MSAILAISSLLCADTAPQSDANLYQIHLQHQCMTNAFPWNTGRLQYFVRKPEDESDCCAWRGVRCTDALVTTLVLVKPIARKWSKVNVAWLPQTLQFIQLRNPTLVDFSLRDIPRDARYFRSTSSYTIGSSSNGVLNFADLPSKIEELDISVISDYLFSTVIIRSVPSTLVQCCIQSMQHLKSVYVMNSALPEGLDCIRFCAHKCKFRALDSPKVDRRIIKWSFGDPPQFFAHAEKCAIIAEEIRPEVNAIFGDPDF